MQCFVVDTKSTFFRSLISAPKYTEMIMVLKKNYWGDFFFTNVLKAFIALLFVLPIVFDVRIINSCIHACFQPLSFKLYEFFFFLFFYHSNV